MNQRDLKKIISVGIGISNRIAVGEGFVRIADLLSALDVEIQFRPLLVEGVIAKPKDATGGRWLILIDSEIHGDLTKEISNESSSHPLNIRVRNTIAHELVHVLSFRVADMGLEEKLSNEDLVKEIEDQTEQLSAILLVPQSAFEKALDLLPDGLTPEELGKACKRWAISAPILVRRFELLPQIDDYRLRYHTALKDVAIGVGDWVNANTPKLNPAWLYSNFSEVSPEFVIKLRNKEDFSVTDLFQADSFSLNGGNQSSTKAEIPGGTFANPNFEKFQMRFSVGMTDTKRARFLWTAKKIKDTATT